MKREKWLRPVGRVKVRKELQQKKPQRQVPNTDGTDAPDTDEEAGQDQASPDDEPADSEEGSAQGEGSDEGMTTARSLTKKSRGCSWGNLA